MSDYRQQLSHLRQLQPDAKQVAFFDLDKTLISVYSALPLLLEQLKAKQVSSLGALQQILMALGQSRDMYEFEEVMGAAINMLEGVSEQEFTKMGDLLFHKHLQKNVYLEAQELVDAHRQLDHQLVVVTSATRYQVEPVAEALGIEYILCTEVEVKKGKLTGVIKGQPCWAEGKLSAARNWSRGKKLSLKNAWFYSDAMDDLPLLEAVGHPVAVNADPALSHHAKVEDWPNYTFRSRSRVTLMDIARTAAMYSSILPAQMLGKAASLLGGMSKKRAALMGFTTFSEVGLDLAGVKLQVKNEKYLWEQRPAIFLVNHQSILDGFITPKLVQRDYFMMGKKEARDMPVLGKAMEDAGFILFDRGDREAALAACDVAAERIRQGESLCIAPEGTRSYTKKMEPFKKGAFHIALQTGAPIVPIVVKNATELWPRGQSFVRPGTVHIEILKPISTKKWTKATLDKHLDDLYHKYLTALNTPD